MPRATSSASTSSNFWPLDLSTPVTLANAPFSLSFMAMSRKRAAFSEAVSFLGGML